MLIKDKKSNKYCTSYGRSDGIPARMCTAIDNSVRLTLEAMDAADYGYKTSEAKDTVEQGRCS